MVGIQAAAAAAVPGVAVALPRIVHPCPILTIERIV